VAKFSHGSVLYLDDTTHRSLEDAPMLTGPRALR
jgi:hypothetical protein